ncbi:MAG: hypothetical protein OQK12_16385, partial [Motiliproteus sp.]|nr:hypothetical protein [Motiliproteus sp.]
MTLVNQGFETGDLTGWDTIGEVTAAGQTNVTTSNGTNYLISPNDTTMAFLDSFGASVSEIESFFGIASGSLDAAQMAGPSLNNGTGSDGGGGGEEGGGGVVIPPIDTGSPNGNSDLTNGSAISQNFFANAGDTIDMSWNYAARDYVPFTDPSFAVLVAPDGTAFIDVLASTTGPGLVTGSDCISGVFSFAQQLNQTGEYKLGFAVANTGDTAFNA